MILAFLGFSGHNFEQLLLTPPLKHNYQIDELWFSGGVAELMVNNGSDLTRIDSETSLADLLPFQDLGLLVAQALDEKLRAAEINYWIPPSPIRATVIGAGLHATQLSGSTIEASSIDLPIKNVPLIRIALPQKFGPDNFSSEQLGESGLSVANQSAVATNAVNSNRSDFDRSQSDCSGADLSDLDRPYLDPSGSDLSNSDLSNSDLSAASPPAASHPDSNRFVALSSTSNLSSSIGSIRSFEVLNESGGALIAGALEGLLALGLKRLDIDATKTTVALLLESLPGLSYAELRIVASRLAHALKVSQVMQPYIIIVPDDVAAALGLLLRRELGNSKVIVIDGIDCSDGDYMDLGLPISTSVQGSSSFSLPIVIKSLLFA